MPVYNGIDHNDPDRFKYVRCSYCHKIRQKFQMIEVASKFFCTVEHSTQYWRGGKLND
jgi:hypothetical protein